MIRGKADAQPLALAHRVARRLIYVPALVHAELSPVHAAKKRLNELRAAEQISQSGYGLLARLLESLENSDLERDDRLDDLVHEVALSLSASSSAFTYGELQRLLTLL